MDIYELAKEMPTTDYYDMASGYIYHIQEYTRLKELGLPTPGIGVTSWDGTFLGYAQPLDDNDQ